MSYFEDLLEKRRKESSTSGGSIGSLLEARRSGKSFDWGIKVEDEKEEEKPKPIVEQKKSFSQKAKETATNIGRELFGHYETVYKAEPVRKLIALEQQRDTIQRAIDKPYSVEEDKNLGPLGKWLMKNKQTSTSKDEVKQKNIQALNEINAKIAEIKPRADATGITKEQLAAAQAMVFLDLATFGRGSAAVQGVKGAAKLTFKQAAKMFLLRRLEEAPIGGAFAGLESVRQGEKDPKKIAANTIIGTLIAPVIGSGIEGTTFVGGKIAGKIASKFTKPVISAERKLIRETLQEDYNKYLVDGLENDVLKKEVAKNSEKSPVVTSSLRESFYELGEDIPKLEKRGIFQNPELELDHAGEIVYSRMSYQARKEVREEIGNLINTDGLSDKDAIVKGVNNILKLPNSREVAPKLSKYTDSVIGIVNDKIPQLEQEVADFGRVIQEVVDNRNKPEIPKVAEETGKLKLDIEVKQGKKNFQQFDAKNNKSIITLADDATEATKWHEVAHAIDRQNPEVRAKLTPEIEQLTGTKAPTNEDMGDALKLIINNPELRAKYPELSAVIDSVPDDITGKLQISKVAQRRASEIPTEKIEEPVVVGKGGKKTTTKEPKFAKGFTTSKFYEGTGGENRVIKHQAINSTQDVIDLNKGLATKYEGLFREIKGGRKPNEVTLREAEELGWDIEKIKKIPQGALLNDAQTAAVAQVKADLMLQLAEKARQYDSFKSPAIKDEMSDIVSKILYADAVTKRSEIELGRAIQIKKNIPIPREFDDDIIKKLDDWGVRDAKDIKSAVKAVDKLEEATAKDVFWTAYYNSILSGPTTSIKNFFDTGINTTMEQIQTAIRQPGNIGMQGQALKRGMVEGWQLFKDVLSGKVVPEGANKFDLSKKSFKNSFMRKIQVVGRFLQAQDEFWKSVNKEASISSIAYDEANKLVKGRDAVRAKTLELINNPTPEMYDQAIKEALRNTYNQEHPEGWVGVVANAARQTTDRIAPLKPIVPFTRIVANVLNAGIDYTPMGLKRAFEYKFSGGQYAGREFQQQIGRVVIGTTGMALLFGQALKGNITGAGPSNSNLRNELKTQGWKPNSVKIGDKYVSYQNFGALSLPLGLIANLAEANKYGNMDAKSLDSKLAYMVFGMADTILSASFLTGAKRLFDAMRYKDEKWFKVYASQILTAFYPNLLQQMGRFFQTDTKSPVTFKDIVLNDLGFPFNAGVRPKMNTFGEPVKDKRGFLSKFVGLSITPEEENELSPALKKLSDNNVALNIPNKSTKVQFRGARESRQLNDSELYEYQKIYGQNIKKLMLSQRNAILRAKNIDQLDAIVDRMKNDAEAMSKGQFVNKFRK